MLARSGCLTMPGRCGRRCSRRRRCKAPRRDSKLEEVENVAAQHLIGFDRSGEAPGDGKARRAASVGEAVLASEERNEEGR